MRSIGHDGYISGTWLASCFLVVVLAGNVASEKPHIIVIINEDLHFRWHLKS
jgi:hypothetical protein